MAWYIVFTPEDGDPFIYAGESSPLTREEGLGIIERSFENGEHTRKIYEKTALDTWQNGNAVVQLVSDKKLNRVLGGTQTNGT